MTKADGLAERDRRLKSKTLTATGPWADGRHGCPKVLLIDFSGYGVMTHVLALLDEADHKSWEYTVLYATDDLRPGVDSYRAALADRRIPSLTIPVRQTLQPGDVAALLKTVAVINRLQPDLVHCHSSKAGAIGRVAAKICGVPAVFTPHSFSFQLARNGSRKHKILKAVERTLGTVTNAVAAVSETELSLAVDEGIAPRHRAHLIPNGVDLHRCAEAFELRAETRRQLGLAELEKVVCFVGRLAPQKMPHIVVGAAEILARREHEPPTFLMIGNGPLDSEIDNLIARAQLQPIVRRLGWRSHDETLRILASADAMVLPSRYEGLPYVALEAQAVRTVPILTDVPGSRDAIIDDVTGLLIPVDDAAALAQSVCRVLTDPTLRRRLEEEGLRHVTKNYSSRQMARRIEQLYATTLGFEHGVTNLPDSSRT